MSKAKERHSVSSKLETLAFRKVAVISGTECLLRIERSLATDWRWIAAAEANDRTEVWRLHQFEQEHEEAMKWAYTLARALTEYHGPEYPSDYRLGWTKTEPAVRPPRPN